PTEAQWEFACRGWTLTALNNEKNLSDAEECPEADEVSWYAYNSDMPQPVGKKKANNFGLYDMHGNVCEWCLDWFDDYPTGATVTDPAGPDTGTERVHRGGSWYYDANACRSAFRHCMEPEDKDSTIGFRVVLSPVHQDDDTPDPGHDDPPDDPPVVVVDPTPGQNITIPLSDTVNLELIWVEPSTFVMGSPEDELGRWSDETQHEVTLTYGYWLGKYELTQAQYEAVKGSNPSYFKGADLPVECITFYGAQSFCEKLTEIERAAGRLSEKYVYTIPSEAQWEYACRAGTTTALNSGKNLSDKKECSEMNEVGWYKSNSDSTTHPVGQKKPNAWGFYDMHGNVYEWCWDTYGAYPTSPVTDPMGASWGSCTVIRGGSCMDTSDGCRSAYRNYTYEYNGYNNLGLRVALVPAE
ncbi:MAG: formylglycine-generating enzyme family protein, partial [Verrucomicrobia bacterium]|nr:formylglycine-generating enzyme family protein [Verrucomicrobiota bacterium]